VTSTARHRTEVNATTSPERKTLIRKLWPLVALAVLALIGAGCSNGSAENGNTGSGSAGSTGTGGDKNAADQDKAVKFAECIRGHGVPDFPDPNAKGEFVYGVSVSPAVWQKAVDACRDLQPPGTLSAKRSPEQQSASLRFAQCMRENGVEDFPDPANGEPLVNTYRIPSANRPGGMAILNAAMQKCRASIAEAMGGQ
jgi:hypothetical protein